MMDCPKCGSEYEKRLVLTEIGSEQTSIRSYTDFCMVVEEHNEYDAEIKIFLHEQY